MSWMVLERKGKGNNFEDGDEVDDEVDDSGREVERRMGDV